jgi:hypothetical protein
MNRKLRIWQFSVFHLFVVLSASALIVPIALLWLRKPRESSTPPQKSGAPTDLATYLPKGHRLYNLVIEPKGVPLLEVTHQLKNGGELRLYSTKRQVRNPKSGAIVPNAHRNDLSLEFTERGASKPKPIWSFAKGDIDARIVGYSDPYGFLICDDAVPLLALVFLDEQFLYFAEIDLRNAPASSTTSLPWESYKLTHFLMERFDDANWEPRFAIRNLQREKDGWSMEVGIKGEVLRLKRTGYGKWVQLPNATKSTTAASDE